MSTYQRASADVGAATGIASRAAALTVILDSLWVSGDDPKRG